VPRDRGQTLVELLFTIGLILTISAIALPAVRDAIDAQRTAAAARYLAGRVQLARMEAVKRSANVGLRFEPAGADYTFAVYLDGNRNGIRTADIRNGTDGLLRAAETVGEKYPTVKFGLMTGVPDADGSEDQAGGDGVRVGSARILTLSPNGTATAGTLYVHGHRLQYAVRVLGVTGRTRVLRFDAKSGRWISQ
jgi:Tfp pilus assembly protein FimT